MPSILGTYLGLTHSTRVAQILRDIERERGCVLKSKGRGEAVGSHERQDHECV